MTLERAPKQEQLPVVETDHSVSYLGVTLDKAEQSSPFVPDRSHYEDYINDRFSLELQKKIATSFKQGDPVLIEGGTSIGKTTTVRKMCAELGWEEHYANLNGATDVEDLMGRYIPNPHKKNPDDPEFIFADGKVTSGLRQEEGKTKVVIIDELNSASPAILIRLHEVLDALERNGNVVLAEDASETVAVNKGKTKVIALMNPPGKGYFGREPLDPAQLRRWVYLKESSELPKDTFQHSTRALFGLESSTSAVAPDTWLPTRETPLSPEELAQIPGINDVIPLYEEFHYASKELVKKRKVAADQPQPFTFDDRVEPRRVRDFLCHFYRGDINETIQQALRYYYANKLESEEDRNKLAELISHVAAAPEVASKRRGLGESTEPQQEQAPPVADKSAERRAAAARLLDGVAVPEHVKDKIRAIEESLESHDTADAAEAREILKQDFIGPQEIEKALGIKIKPEEVPKIPFSREDLEKAQELNQMLILRWDKAPDGSPLTMRKMDAILTPIFGKAGKGKALFKIDWYDTEDFANKETPNPAWALVSKELLPDSTSKNYVEQTQKLAHYLSEVFGTHLLPEYAEAINEFNTQKEELSSLIDSDWQKAAERLAALKLNQLTRPTAPEALYDMFVYFQNTSKRLHENDYVWTKTRASDGGLVVVGTAVAEGVLVHGWRPGNSYGDLGAALSRSH